MSPRPRATSDAEILAATHRAVNRLGPLKLTLADVAAEAGVSPATLVQRFGSKRGLLLAFAQLGGGSQAEMFAQIRAAHPTAAAAIGGVAECMAGMAETPEALSNALAFLQIDLTDPEFHRYALAHAREMRAGIRGLLDEAVASGEIARCDTARLARAVQAMINGSLLQWAIDREGDVARRLRDDVETLLAPYRRPGPPRR